MNSNWHIKKLGDICNTSSGGTPSRKNESYYSGEIPWIKSGELNFNTIRDAEEKITEEAISESSAKIFPKGTLLIALYGATVGKLAFLGIDAATNQAVCAIMPENGLDNKYLYWYLFYIKRDLVGKSIGGAQPNISQTILKDVDVPVPPLPTQHHIVEKIEELFSELDNGVENLKKAQKQLKTYRQAVLKDAFEGKLTKEWREQQVDLSTPEELLRQIKAERKAHRQRELAKWEKEVEQWEKYGMPGRKPRKPRKQSTQPPLSEDELSNPTVLPNEWKWVQFDNVCEVKTNLVDPTQYKSYPHIAPNYIKKYTGQLLEYNSIEEDGVTSPKHLFYSGQIVYSKIRPYLSKLILAHFDGLCSADMYPIETSLNIKYLYYLMLSDVFLNQASTAGSRSVLPKINQKELGIIRLPICSMREQEEIVNSIESSISIIDQLEQTIKENLQKAEALRQSILKKAFGGELVD